MARVTDRLGQAFPGGSGWIAAIDRWILVFMAALFFVTALLGFVPDSLNKIAEIQSGRRAPFPPSLHVHAVLMGAWLTLLLAQATLMATGNTAHHRKLGMAGLVLAPMIVLSILVVVPVMYAQVHDALAQASPEAQAGLRRALTGKGNSMLLQARAAGLFMILAWLALRARKGDPGFHRRAMFLATLVTLGAAVNRVPFLPTTMPGSPVALDLYLLSLLVPLFLWDLFRLGRVHRAYLVWFALWVPLTVAVHTLWGSAEWQALAPRLLGYG